MKYEWDKNKSRDNLKKHGIRFEEAILIFEGVVLSVRDERRDYDEERWVSVGAINQTIVILVVHVFRESKCRIISARKANKQEKFAYYGYLKETLKSD